MVANYAVVGDWFRRHQTTGVVRKATLQHWVCSELWFSAGWKAIRSADVGSGSEAGRDAPRGQARVELF